MPRLAAAALLIGLVLAGCGGGSKTDTQPTTATNSVVLRDAGNRNYGPHYFETPSHNIGCYVSAHDARCDIRQRTWSPPPEPKSCITIGLDYGQGIVVGPDRAQFICAGDTVLGGPATLPYRRSAQRGTLLCVSRVAGVTCRNTANGHGFFLSRAAYRLF